jgi:uncharacterized membrane protein
MIQEKIKPFNLLATHQCVNYPITTSHDENIDIQIHIDIKQILNMYFKT